MILVVGASGTLGTVITRMLLAQNKSVRLLVRPQSQALVDPRAEYVLGDLKDRASLDRACQGIETVITTAILATGTR
jgi:NADH dehydrogenase